MFLMQTAVARSTSDLGAISCRMCSLGGFYRLYSYRIERLVSLCRLLSICSDFSREDRGIGLEAGGRAVYIFGCDRRHCRQSLCRVWWLVMLYAGLSSCRVEFRFDKAIR